MLIIIDSDPIDSRRKANVEQEFIEETESEAIRFELHLNQCLRNNVVTISAEKAGYYYQYRRINKVGNAEYYECKTCGKNGARATLRNGRFTVSESRQHNEKCLPIRSAKIIGKQADREARLDASQGVHPHIASERGFEKSWKANAEDEYPETFVQGGPLRKWYRNSMEHIEMGNIPLRFQNYILDGFATGDHGKISALVCGRHVQNQSERNCTMLVYSWIGR